MWSCKGAVIFPSSNYEQYKAAVLCAFSPNLQFMGVIQLKNKSSSSTVLLFSL